MIAKVDALHAGGTEPVLVSWEFYSAVFLVALESKCVMLHIICGELAQMVGEGSRTGPHTLYEALKNIFIKCSDPIS